MSIVDTEGDVWSATVIIADGEGGVGIILKDGDAVSENLRVALEH